MLQQSGNLLGNLFKWWLPLILLCLASFLIQMHLYLHKDVAYLLHEAGLMLQGQTYANQIFEPNPPLILFLSMPPYWLAKLSGLSVLASLRLYIVLLAFISATVCYFVIRKLFQDKTLVLFIAYTLALTLLFLPAHQFGQREHLLMIFIFPYLLMTGARLENIKIPVSLAIVSGIMASIGFSIKPHFLPALVLIELYVCYVRRSILGWVRIETILIATWMISYAAIILVFYQSYLKIVYPLWWPYYDALAHSYRAILIYPSLLYCFASLIFYFLMRKTNQHRRVSTVLLLALIGFIITFILPRVNWYYHVLPALSTAIVLLSISLGQLTRKGLSEQYASIFTVIMSLFFVIPFIQSSLFIGDSLLFYASDNTWSRLVTFLKENKGNNSFYYFSNTHSLVVLENYTGANYVGRFPSLFWNYDLLLMKYKPSMEATDYDETKFPWFAGAVADDLESKKPRFVIVDLDSENEKYVGTKMDYIDELSQSARFKEIWGHYHYLTKIGEYTIYQFK